MAYSFQALAELHDASIRIQELAHELAAEVEAATEGVLLQARKRNPGYQDGIGMCPEIYLLQSSTVYRDKIFPFHQRYARCTICFLAEALLRQPNPPHFRPLPPNSRHEYAIELNGQDVGFMRNGWNDGYLTGSEPEWVFRDDLNEMTRQMIQKTWMTYRITYREWDFSHSKAV